VNEWEWNLLEDKAQLETIEVDGVVLKRGDRVRLNPKAGGDILDIALRGQIAMLFDVGLLQLRRITWTAPAALLEKLIEYEAVHTIGSWVDLKNRLDTTLSKKLLYKFLCIALSHVIHQRKRTHLIFPP